MAWEQPGFKITRPAGGNLTAAQYTFVKMNASKQVVACTAATDIPIGVLQNKPNTGDEAEVMVFGVTKVVSGADLAAGNLIGPDTAGRAVALVAGTDITKYVCGQILDDNSALSGLSAAMIDCAAPHRAT